eukprot:362147-Chlamydomonas_euryale.AAC.1
MQVGRTSQRSRVQGAPAWRCRSSGPLQSCRAQAPRTFAYVPKPGTTRPVPKPAQLSAVLGTLMGGRVSASLGWAFRPAGG